MSKSEIELIQSHGDLGFFSQLNGNRLSVNFAGVLSTSNNSLSFSVDNTADLAGNFLAPISFSYQVLALADFNLDNKIDVLINNAGVTQDNLTIRMSKDEWDKVININLTSTFLLSKFVIKKMLKKKFGKIINVTSVVGHTGNLGQANYSASKGGILSMSKSLSLEYAKKNIMINCIAPGFIETAMTEKINDEYKNQLKSKIPMDRFGTPQDIANCAAFLCSDLSNYITGETIHVNGGMYFS